LKEVEKSSGRSLRAIGVITKPDTMNIEDIHILNDFVADRVDRAVSLSDGYFVVNNKVENEESYFNSTFGRTSDIVKLGKFGINNLHQYLKLQLVKSIRSCLPHVKHEICELFKVKQYEYQCLGGDSPNNHNKEYFVNKTITELCSGLINSIDSKFVRDNVGYVIGESIRNMSYTMKHIIPFGNDIATTKYFQELIKYSRSYKLTSQASLEEMIDRCLKEPTYSPTNVLIVSVRKCVAEIEVALVMTINKLINCGSMELIQLYPQFKEFIFGQIKEKLHEYCDQTLKEIQKYLEKEETVVWSTDPEFSSLLNLYYYKYNTSNTIMKTLGIGGTMDTILKTSQKKHQDENINYFEFSAEQVKTISTSYYKSVINRAKDIIAQDIICGIVVKIKKDIMGSLLIATLSQNLEELLSEDRNIVIKRKYAKQSVDSISQMLSELSGF
jgi:hypothetical protein